MEIVFVSWRFFLHLLYTLLSLHKYTRQREKKTHIYIYIVYIYSVFYLCLLWMQNHHHHTYILWCDIIRAIARQTHLARWTDKTDASTSHGYPVPAYTRQCTREFRVIFRRNSLQKVREIACIARHF